MPGLTTTSAAAGILYAGVPHADINVSQQVEIPCPESLVEEKGEVARDRPVHDGHQIHQHRDAVDQIPALVLGTRLQKYMNVSTSIRLPRLQAHGGGTLPLRTARPLLAYPTVIGLSGVS
jgi:hypothetical protein